VLQLAVSGRTTFQQLMALFFSLTPSTENGLMSLKLNCMSVSHMVLQICLNIKICSLWQAVFHIQFIFAMYVVFVVSENKLQMSLI